MDGLGPDATGWQAPSADEISPRVKAHTDLAEQLAHSRSLHHAVLDGMLDPVVCINAQGIILDASRSVRDVFGYDAKELTGQNVSLLMTGEHRDDHDGHLARYLSTGETKILGDTRQFSVKRKDGEVIEVELSVNRVDLPGASEPIFVGSFRDVTERKRARRAETSMLRALAAIGESSAMLAHEIKNPVTAVNLALRAVADQLGEDEQTILEDLASRLRRLELQMRQTLTFAKPLDLKLTRCGVAGLVDDTILACRPILSSHNAVVSVDVAADVPPLLVDHGRIEEVLTNLLLNAVEVGDVHKVSVRVVAPAAGRRDVVFTVDDDGPGISPKVREKLFSPFVTTKQEGTGLGLPICRRILEEHGGTIDVVESTLGGACLEVRLPVDGPPDKEGFAEYHASPRTSSSETSP